MSNFQRRPRRHLHHPHRVPQLYREPSDPIGAHLDALRRSGKIHSHECVALANAAVGASGSVRSWRKGVSALSGKLRPGTPIATFLTHEGKPSKFYGDGTVGRPGAGVDHAAVFKNYVRNRRGEITGMNVYEQYAGSHGQIRLRTYSFEHGFGERNASNYYAINDANGRPLGGKNNPMSGNPDTTIAAATPRPSHRRDPQLALQQQSRRRLTQLTSHARVA